MNMREIANMVAEAETEAEPTAMLRLVVAALEGAGYDLSAHPMLQEDIHVDAPDGTRWSISVRPVAPKPRLRRWNTRTGEYMD